jgi:hypothetical protein
MCLKRRDRLVVFRLSQDEYQKLKTASESNGARSLSDFTRSEIMNLLDSRTGGSLRDETLSSMAHSMNELHGAMLRLQSILEGVSYAKTVAGS